MFIQNNILKLVHSIAENSVEIEEKNRFAFMLLIGMIESQRDLVTFGDTQSQSNNNQQLPQSTEQAMH